MRILILVIIKHFQRSMLNQNPKPYFNQVTMIESQYESKRRNLTNLANSNNSSLLQNKSPLRQRENTNSINTPSRLQAQNGNKISLSPIRSRRNEQPTSNVRSTAISRKKSVQNFCENHNTKLAKFMIDKENEQMYFCERCAISLISNGFKLMKINSQQQEKEVENPRIRQINDFVKQLEMMQSSMNKKKQAISQIVSVGQSELDGELQKIEQFYAQIYQIVDEHKRRVVQEMKTEYAKSSRNATSMKQKIEQAIKDSLNMKQDIATSVNSVILEVMEHEFRSVMNQYYGNLEGFKEICNMKIEPAIKVRTLTFRDAETVCQNLIEGLVIEWNDEDGEPEEQAPVSKPEPNLYQYQSRPRREQQESDRENPIECLETEQRKPTKQISGLFCSFDE